MESGLIAIEGTEQDIEDINNGFKDSSNAADQEPVKTLEPIEPGKAPAADATAPDVVQEPVEEAKAEEPAKAEPKGSKKK